MKNLAFTFIFVLFCHTLFSQKIVKATSQGWAGGICCRTGTNYVVTFELTEIPRKVVLDKIYLKNYGEINGAISFIDKADGSRLYTLSFGIHNDYYGDIEIDELSDDSIRRQQTLPEINGAALILLQFDNEFVKLEVDKFEELMYLAYP